MTRASRFFSIVLAVPSMFGVACTSAPTDSKMPSMRALQSSMSMVSLHGTSILQPSSNVTYYVYPFQLPTYAVNTQAEFWLNGTFSGYGPGHAWNRDIKWRSPCGSTSAGTTLYSASTPLFNGQAYNEDYTQSASFTPGGYGQYDIESRSINRSCANGFCSDADSITSHRCVTLADFSVAISGPTSVYADRSVAWSAVVAGGAAPISYQWYKNGVPSGTTQSVTLSTGPISFLLRVDATDAMSQTRTASESVTVALAPPTNCQMQWIRPPANYLKVTWVNSSDAGVSTEVQILKNGGSWTTVGTVSPGITQYIYTLGTQTGLFYGRVRHTKSGYNSSAWCNTGAVTVG